MVLLSRNGVVWLVVRGRGGAMRCGTLFAPGADAGSGLHAPCEGDAGAAGGKFFFRFYRRPLYKAMNYPASPCTLLCLRSVVFWMPRAFVMHETWLLALSRMRPMIFQYMVFWAFPVACVGVPSLQGSWRHGHVMGNAAGSAPCSPCVRPPSLLQVMRSWTSMLRSTSWSTCARGGTWYGHGRTRVR